jgi:hypothetical protein
LKNILVGIAVLLVVVTAAGLDEIHCIVMGIAVLLVVLTAVVLDGYNLVVGDSIAVGSDSSCGT